MSTPWAGIAMPGVDTTNPASMPAGLSIPARGLLFDIDGVLVSSARSAERAWSRWAAEFDVDADAVLAVIHGRRSVDTVAQFLDRRRTGAAVARIDELELADAVTVHECPGAGRLLRGLQPSLWAVVTSASADLARARMRAAGIPAPSTLITGADVSRGKPAPDAFLAAAESLGLSPFETLVFEDSPPGIAAGFAAGAATVIGVGQRALDTTADVVVPDLQGLAFVAGALHIPAARVLRDVMTHPISSEAP